MASQQSSLSVLLIQVLLSDIIILVPSQQSAIYNQNIFVQYHLQMLCPFVQKHHYSILNPFESFLCQYPPKQSDYSCPLTTYPVSTFSLPNSHHLSNDLPEQQWWQLTRPQQYYKAIQHLPISLHTRLPLLYLPITQQPQHKIQSLLVQPPCKHNHPSSYPLNYHHHIHTLTNSQLQPNRQSIKLQSQSYLSINITQQKNHPTINTLNHLASLPFIINYSQCQAYTHSTIGLQFILSSQKQALTFKNPLKASYYYINKKQRHYMYQLKPQLDKTIQTVNVHIALHQQQVSIRLTDKRNRTITVLAVVDPNTIQTIQNFPFNNIEHFYQSLLEAVNNQSNSLENIFKIDQQCLQLSLNNQTLRIKIKITEQRIDGLSDQDLSAGIKSLDAIRTDIERRLNASDQKVNAFMDQIRRKVEEGLKKIEALIGFSSTEATANLEKRQQQYLNQLNALFRSEVQAYMNNFACLRDEQKMSWLRMEQAQNSHKLMLDSLTRQLQRTRFEIDQVDLNSNRKLKQVADKAQQDDKVLKQIIQATLRAHAELINTTRWQLKHLKLPKGYQEPNSVIQHSFSKLTQVEHDSDSDDSETQHQYRTYRYTETMNKNEEKTRESVRQNPKPNYIRPHK